MDHNTPIIKVTKDNLFHLYDSIDRYMAMEGLRLRNIFYVCYDIVDEVYVLYKSIFSCHKFNYKLFCRLYYDNIPMKDFLSKEDMYI